MSRRAGQRVLVTAVGARHTLLLSALLTIALGASVGAVLVLDRARAERRHRLTGFGREDEAVAAP